MAEITDDYNIITAAGLTLGYEKAGAVIQDASFGIGAKDFVIITGKSGSGKSTLLKSFYGGIDIISGEQGAGREAPGTQEFITKATEEL